MREGYRRPARRLLALALLTMLTAAPGPAHWQGYSYHDATYTPLSDCRPSDAETTTHACPTLSYPAEWQILDARYTDITGDGAPECVLLVWRPWRDWPIMRWMQGTSPIAANRDADGYSAHIILTVPDARHGYRELWAGSALAVPILAIASGDVDGDQRQELVALEGDYETGRAGPARQVAVWRWNGFGFTLHWRGPQGHFTALRLQDCNGDAQPDILIRAAP